MNDLVRAWLRRATGPDARVRDAFLFLATVAVFLLAVW